MKRRALLLGSAVAALSAKAQPLPVISDTVPPGVGPGPLGTGVPLGASLDLSFMNPGTLDPRITFTRGSTATYFDATGTLQTAGNNYILWSQDFSNAFWSIVGTVTKTPAYALGPDNTMSAARVQLSAGAQNTNDFTQNANNGQQGLGASLTNTFSMWVRSNTGGNQSFALKLTQGLVADHFSADLIATSAWQRFSFTQVFVAGATSFPVCGITNASTGAAADVVVWGGQLDVNSGYMSTYIPTTSNPVVAAPRWDYDPVTHVLRGLLIEEARTNYVLQSGAMAIAPWVAQRSTLTAGAAIAPDGTMTATRLTEDTTVTNSHYTGQSPASVPVNAPVTFSCYVLNSTRRYGLIQLYDSTTSVNNLLASFDMVSGTISAPTLSGAATTASSSITNVGGGWYRVSVTATLSASATTGVICRVFLCNAPGVSVYTGDGVSSYFIWGAQVDAGAFPSSYIPTTGATVTRSADLASMPTGTWLNATNGTYQAEAIPNGAPATLPVIISGNAGSPVIAAGADSKLVASIRSGAAVFSATGPAFAFGAVNKAAFAYLSGASTAAVNGTMIGPSATALSVTGTTVEFGSDGVTPGNNALDGWLRRVRYWPRVLSNSEMQSATR